MWQLRFGCPILAARVAATPAAELIRPRSLDHVTEVVGIERPCLVDDGQVVVQRADGAERRYVRHAGALSCKREVGCGSDELERHLVAEEPRAAAGALAIGRC